MRSCLLYTSVDQMPKKMRRTLYLKDDDWRMSFLMGSYITLTNLKEEEIQRIIDQRISPLYVSVHAYDDEMRKLLFGNPDAVKTFGIIERLEMCIRDSKKDASAYARAEGKETPHESCSFKAVENSGGSSSRRAAASKRAEVSAFSAPKER